MKLHLGGVLYALGRYDDARTHFDRCLTLSRLVGFRRGEATALFLDDLPTYHVLPPVHYYMGLAQEAMKSSGAGESFRTFLAIKQRGDDPLVPDARHRLAR